MPLPPVQSPEVPQYLLEAMAVVQGLTLDELQLGAAPTIFKYLPKKSLAFKDGLKEIIRDISRCLQMKQLQPKAIDGLWKVLFYLPRFLFFIPIGGPPVGTRQVAAVAENVRLFKGENAAARLWRASHNFGVSSTLYNVSEDDINEGIYESKDEIAQNRKWERVKVACADGDITKAAQYAAPEAKIANITSERLGKYVEEVFKVPDGATKNPPPSDREVAEFIDTILEDAERNEEAESRPPMWIK
jgi:hypothetical protein